VKAKASITAPSWPGAASPLSARVSIEKTERLRLTRAQSQSQRRSCGEGRADMHGFGHSCQRKIRQR
jgi:hypothetical protein